MFGTYPLVQAQHYANMAHLRAQSVAHSGLAGLGSQQQQSGLAMSSDSFNFNYAPKHETYREELQAETDIWLKD